MRVVPGQRDDERRHRLSERPLEGGRLAVKHLLHALQLGSLVCGTFGLVAGDQHVHIAAHLERCTQRLMGGVLQMRVVVLGNEKHGHQITPASVLSLATSSATDFTFTPASRFGGSLVEITLSLGLTSTP